MTTSEPVRTVYIQCELCGEVRKTTLAAKEASKFLRYGVGGKDDPIILNHLFCEPEKD